MSITYINIKVIQLENFGGRCFICDEAEDLEVSPVPLHGPHLVSATGMMIDRAANSGRGYLSTSPSGAVIYRYLLMLSHYQSYLLLNVDIDTVMNTKYFENEKDSISAFFTTGI